MNIKNITIGIGLLIVAGIAGFCGSLLHGNSSSAVSTQAPLGAANSYASGEVYTNPYIFVNGFSAGNSQQLYVGASGQIDAQTGIVEGGINATSTAGNATFAPSDVQNISTVYVTPTVGNETLTLPATTTAGMSTWIPNPGDSDTFGIINATTSAFTVNIAGGTGTLLKNASTTSAAIVSGGEAFMRCTRKVNTDILCWMSIAE